MTKHGRAVFSAGVRKLVGNVAAPGHPSPRFVVGKFLANSAFERAMRRSMARVLELPPIGSRASNVIEQMTDERRGQGDQRAIRVDRMIEVSVRSTPGTSPILSMTRSSWVTLGAVAMAIRS